MDRPTEKKTGRNWNGLQCVYLADNDDDGDDDDDESGKLWNEMNNEEGECKDTGRCNVRSLSLHVAYVHHNGRSHLKKGVYFTLLPKPSGMVHIV